MIDGKHPSVARDVPPQLIVLFEKSNLPVGEKHEFIFVFTVVKIMTGATEIDPDAVRSFFGVLRLSLAVAPDGNHAEINPEPVAKLVFVAGREITVDTAPDVIAFRLNTNGFGNGQGSVFMDPDI